MPNNNINIETKNDNSKSANKQTIFSKQKIINVVLTLVVIFFISLIAISVTNTRKPLPCCKNQHKAIGNMESFALIDGIKINKTPMTSNLITQDYTNNSMINFIKNNTSSGDTVIDFSDHLDIHTLFFAKLLGLSGRLYSFVVQPINDDFINKIKENVQLNNFENRVIIENFDFQSNTAKDLPINSKLVNLQNINTILIQCNYDYLKIITNITTLIKRSPKISIIMNYEKSKLNNYAAANELFNKGFQIYIIKADGKIKATNINAIKNIEHAYFLFKKEPNCS